MSSGGEIGPHIVLYLTSRNVIAHLVVTLRAHIFLFAFHRSNLYYLKVVNGEWVQGTIVGDGSVNVISFAQDNSVSESGLVLTIDDSFVDIGAAVGGGGLVIIGVVSDEL